MKRILYLLLGIVVPCMVMADGIRTYNFPVEKGIPMYGATIKDELGALHYVMFHSNDAHVTKLGRIDNADNGTHMRNLRCGAFCGDKYYGYIVNAYSYTEQVKSFGTVDWNKGEYSVIYDKYTTDDLVAWPILYEMTYDNTNKVCYALGRNDEGLYVSDLYKINLSDGSYEKLTTLNFYAWAMACDYEGNLYMIKGIPDKKGEFYEASSVVRIDQFDNYAEKDEKRIKVEGKNFIPNYTHTMEFDHNSNRLYWIGMSNDGWQKIYELDIHTGNAVETANMMYNMVTGLYIPFKSADNRKAAGKVTDIKGTPAADGSMNVKLEWINPTKNWKGDALETLNNITVARGSEQNIISTLDAYGGMGNKMSYSDESAQKGYNVYYITTHRIEGEKGLTDSVRVFAGPDVPGRPQNVTAKAEGKNVRIDWQAPETGAHGEKYDVNTTVYEIIRMPDSIVIARNVAETTFTDDKIGTKKSYSYIIKASNAEGEGLSEKSAPISIGSAYPVPFADDFSSALCKDMWTAVDINRDGNTFEWAGGGAVDFNRFQIWLNSQHDTNDNIVTPPLATKKGAQYRVKYAVQIGRNDDVHKFYVTTGTAPTEEGMTNRIDSVDNLKIEGYNQIIDYESKFTASSDETYVGIQCMSYASSAESYFAVRDFSVEEIFARDIMALGIEGDKSFINNEASKKIVKVKNAGYEAVGDFKVEIIARDAQGIINVIGSADVKDAVEAGKTIDVEVTATAKAEGEIEVAARIVLDGDMNEANNISPWNVYTVDPEGTSEWNILAEGEKTAVSTTEPMNFFNEFSTVETIYLKDEIKADRNGRITRIAYQYSDNGIQAETDPVNVRIYMANTDKNHYESTACVKDWTPLDKSVLVCEKSITIKPGKNNVLVFDLDTPFYYDHTKNLSIQVWKDGVVLDKFPALFKTYDFGWEVFRSLRYDNPNIEFEFKEQQKFFPVNNIPVLLMAVEFDENSGVFEVDGSNGIVYRDGILYINNTTFAKVMVTDITGKMVYCKNVNAQSLDLNLPGGIYIVRAVDAEGNTHVLKIAR